MTRKSGTKQDEQRIGCTKSSEGCCVVANKQLTGIDKISVSDETIWKMREVLAESIARHIVLLSVSDLQKTDIEPVSA